MNAQIKELAKQATVRESNHYLNSDGEIVVENWEEYVDLNIFAELIVRKCLKQCDEPGVYTKFDMEDSIRRHFGLDP